MRRTTTQQLIYDYKVKIIECKKKLHTSDYKAIKFAEGEIPEEEYVPIREERRAWRAEINRLETRILELSGQLW